MSVALNGTSVGVSGLALIFFIIGCAGYTKEKDTLKSVSWISQDDDYGNVWIGLTALYIDFGSYVSEVMLFSNCGDDSYDDGDDSACSQCERTGKAAVGLLVVATMLCFLSICLSGFSIASSSLPITYANIATSFLSGFLAVIGFGLFMHTCYDELQLDDDYATTLKYGPGSIITLVALLFMWITCVLQIAAAVLNKPANTALNNAPSSNAV